ncbi:MAG: S24 family peptidase [Methylovulum sp.]|uniref:LexA family transcriptional regulator n=1 Tax=Methylovulum sp. TaxID=1916980 RepID=UPI00260DC967|nr:LexA family transcriptional regulator [Methylovulum sp.]MDD2725204.1 S24 family peptidase [Methylovulum sp.]MDD5125437.1 S24 family peptidase [Methylovulum sp.]
MKLNLSQPEAALKFNLPLGSWKSYEKGPSKPGSDAMYNLADGGVNVHWLLTGEGNMLLQPALPSLVTAKELYREPVGSDYQGLLARGAMAEESSEAWQDFALIPYFDVELSMGGGSLIDQELITSHMAFRRDWLQQRGLKAANLLLAKGRGDSMEKTIYHGDLLLIDHTINTIIDDSIYVLMLGAHTVVKRVQQFFDGSLSIISDNDIYPKQTIPPEKAQELKVVGRVKWYAHEI